MTEKAEQASDYKTCPLKRANANDFLVMRNMELSTDDLSTIRRSGAVKMIEPMDDEPRIEVAVGRCDGSRCAWWDDGSDKCGVLSRT